MNCCLHILSVRNSGEMHPDASSGRQVWAKEVVEVAKHLQLFDARRRSPPIVVGHSLGSFVARQVCMELCPTTMGGLVILDGGVPHPVGWLRKAGLQVDPFLKPKEPVKLRRQYKLHEHTPTSRLALSPPQPGVPPYILEHVANTSVRMVSVDAWEWKVHPSYYERSGFMDFIDEVGHPEHVLGLQTRVAVIFGGYSTVVDHHSRVFMRYALGKDVPVVTIPAAGHHCFLDQPLAVVSSLRSIFAGWNCSATSNPKGDLMPRLSDRATLGTNENGGFDGREDLMVERITEMMKKWVDPDSPKKKRPNSSENLEKTDSPKSKSKL